ncbi:acyl-CoA dehydrogenase family protein [Pulveribacter sp.]|uniref:acyl-CoA dehydrogenase family protein n=1 Tax=Pulveribacter sp. TaxID=2678893 RepID=UPI0028AA3473|nr:acyl-CoA dehydrogenase family protein [Pulveribacter sp.]
MDAWDTAGEFPRALYRRAAELGLLGLGYPEEYGGTPASYALRLPLWRALSRHGASGGVLASLLSHNIGLPPVVAYGSDAVRAEVIPPVLAGEAIAALAITEPGGGSDVARLATTARRDGDDYVVSGEKVFITSGLRADWITTAVRTGEPGARGSGGISMLLIPGSSPGLSRSALAKMGWLCSDTTHLRFDEVRVPARYLLGEEGQGFRIIMGNFNAERFGLAASALGFAEACFDEALAWARQRRTFGAALVEHQVIRHKLADMQMRIQSTAAWCEAIAARADAGDTGPEWVAQVCLLKNHATQTMQFCADQAVQILGGMGFMRGTVSERIYREVKVMMIGGGAEEIMKDLAARQLGW